MKRNRASSIACFRLLYIVYTTSESSRSSVDVDFRVHFKNKLFDFEWFEIIENIALVTIQIPLNYLA